MSTKALVKYGRPAGSSSGVITKAHPFGSYTAFKPAPPPLGTYDPALDQQLAGAHRGLGDLEDDTAIQTGRLAEDYQQQQNQVAQTYGDAQADSARFGERELADYGTSTAALQRSYANLGVAQHEGANRLGVLDGGTQAQAAAKRGVNQGIQQKGLDTTHERSVADNALALSRAARGAFEQGAGLAQQYAAPTAGDMSTGDSLATGGRAYQDLGTGLSRAQREDTQYGVDVGQTKSAQAAQMGYDPMTGKPSNESIDPVTGASHKIVFSGGYRYEIDPSGKILSRTRRAKK